MMKMLHGFIYDMFICSKEQSTILEQRVRISFPLGSTILTIEGNTGTGNDANGGAVMKRRRDVSLITCGIRPGYPDPA